MLNFIKIFFNKNSKYFLYSFVLVILLYITNLKINFLYHMNIVPEGDPFSYTMSLLGLLKSMEISPIVGLKNFLSGQWYYAYKFPVLFLGYLIPKAPYLLFYVNYFYLIFFLISIYNFLGNIDYTKHNHFFKRSLLVILLVLTFPFLNGFKSSISLNVLQLDTQFFLLSFCFFLNIYIFLKKFDFNQSIILSISAGFLLWSRGNSILYILVYLLIPSTLYFFYIFKNFKSFINHIKPILLVLIIFTFFAFVYYLICLDNILNYYSVHSKLINSFEFNFINFFKSLLIFAERYPGIYFTIYTNNLTSLYSYISHLIIFIIFLFSLITKNRIILYFTSSYFLFFILLVFNLAPWLIIKFYVDQSAVMILMPIVAITIFYLFKYSYFLNDKVILILSTIFLLYNPLNQQFKLQKQIDQNSEKELVNALELENFSVNILNYSNYNKIALLWYGKYNPPIIDYYRQINNLTPINLSNEDVNQVIRPIAGDPEIYVTKKEFKEYLNNVLNSYNYFILPLMFDDYDKASHLLISKYKNIAKDLLIDSKINFEPVMILNDGIKLLMLKKVKKSNFKNEYIFSSDKNKFPNLITDKIEDYKQYQYSEVLKDNNNNTFVEDFYENNSKTIKITFTESLDISSYGFLEGIHLPESLDRMPSEWHIFGTQDNVIDIQKDINFKNFKSKKIFTLGKTTNTDYLLFKFIGENHKLLRIYGMEFYDNSNNLINKYIETIKFE